MATDYILGTDKEELARLQLQHEIWRPELIKLWDKSKIKLATSILELGCGPGFTSFELLNYIQGQCYLTCVDISDSFLTTVKDKALNLTRINQKVSTHKSYIEDLVLSKTDFDAAFCRWLMIFVPNPEKAIAQIHRHLRTGAQFTIQEYVSYDTFDIVPGFKHMRTIIDAVFKSWRDQGGDPNRGKELPYLLEKVGFHVSLIEPIAKIAQPGDPMLAWPETFFKSFLPRLEKTNYLTTTQIQDFYAEWAEFKTKKGAFFIAPTVINIIAEKR